MKTNPITYALIAGLLSGALFFSPAVRAVMPPHEEAADSDNDDADTPSADADKDDQDSDQSEEKQAEAPPEHNAKMHVKGHVEAEAKTTAQSAQPNLKVASGSWWHPHPGTKWAIQYAGKIDTSLNVAVYDIDLVDTDDAVFKTLRAKGKKIICYFSAGSFEAWRPDAKQFPPSVLGKSNGWKAEKWLDIRKLEILKPIMAARIDLAKQKGCDALDPDNVEGYDNASGFPLTEADQIAYNKMIAELGHAAGMAVGLKNDVDQVGDLIDDFDFQVNEQCFEYSACNRLAPFIKANKPVFNIEYNVDAAKFCPQANAMNFDSVKKKLELDGWVKACR